LEGTRHKSMVEGGGEKVDRPNQGGCDLERHVKKGNLGGERLHKKTGGEEGVG